MSLDDLPKDDPGSSSDLLAIDPDSGPLGQLPRVSIHQARLESILARLDSNAALGPAFSWLSQALGGDAEIKVGAPEVLWRATGLRRTGMVAQFNWPRLTTRLGVGLETPLAHAIVDRLLGFDRLPPESRLPISPVEWGILTYVVAETFKRFADETPCPFGVWDPILDRVGLDPFDTANLGRVVTITWPVRIGPIDGSIRLWLSEALIVRWLGSAKPSISRVPRVVSRAGELTSLWRAQAGTIRLPRGLNTLRAGGVLPFTETKLTGSARSPEGPVELSLNLVGSGGRFRLPTKTVPESAGGRLTVTGPLDHEPTPREALAMPSNTTASPDASPIDVPVTLVAELGRVNLSLTRLADLKPGDVVELGRHAKEPIELTSGGRLIARGELVAIDTELGIRVTHVFL